MGLFKKERIMGWLMRAKLKSLPIIDPDDLSAIKTLFWQLMHRGIFKLGMSPQKMREKRELDRLAEDQFKKLANPQTLISLAQADAYIEDSTRTIDELFDYGVTEEYKKQFIGYNVIPKDRYFWKRTGPCLACFYEQENLKALGLPATAVEFMIRTDFSVWRIYKVLDLSMALRE
jgi:hypothetical protein